LSVSAQARIKIPETFFSATQRSEPDPCFDPYFESFFTVQVAQDISDPNDTCQDPYSCRETLHTFPPTYGEWRLDSDENYFLSSSQEIPQTFNAHNRTAHKTNLFDWSGTGCWTNQPPPAEASSNLDLFWLQEPTVAPELSDPTVHTAGSSGSEHDQKSEAS
jgi:hypothetical protein